LNKDIINQNKELFTLKENLSSSKSSNASLQEKLDKADGRIKKMVLEDVYSNDPILDELQ
jgi:hypothetical protein